MENLNEKLKLIYIHFLIIAISIIGGYTFLHWLIFIKLQVFSLDDGIINVWIPLGLPWIPILIWLRPRVKLLNLKRKKGGGDLPSFYVFIAAFAIIVPTLVAQSYVEKASGKLTQLENINQIGQQEPTKYYSLKSFYIDKFNIGIQTAFDVSGKSNEDFNMNLYVALPIFYTQHDTTNSNCFAWYGVKYHKQVSNRLDDNEKQQEYKKFANESQSDFNMKKVSQFIYLERVGNTKDHQGYNDAIKNNKRFKSNSFTILVPVNEAFEARLGSKFGWIFGAFGIGALVWLIMLIIPKFDEEALAKFSNGEPIEETDMKETLSLFIPREGFYITPIIMYINILIFIIMVVSGLGFISFKSADLLLWGANYRPSTTNGEWWRLLTSTFLHGGLMHLFANMYGLLFVGIFLEPRIGKAKYAIIYLLTGILASVTSLWWHVNTVSVGASGAIFGLYGVFLALLLLKVFPKDFSKVFLLSTSIFIGYNLLVGLTGGIDNAAHIGGLVSGFIIGLILYPQLKQEVEDDEPLDRFGLQSVDETASDKAK